jgi:hypothetical protein
MGDEKMAAKDYAAALKAYLGADSIMGVPTTGIEAARAHIALGQLVEARDVLLRVSRYPEKAGEPEAFGKARTEAAKLAEQLPERIPSLTVEIHGVSPDTVVEVRIDGTVVPNATLGLPRKTNPGRHRVSASAPGYQFVHTNVKLEEREQRVLKLTLGSETSTAEGDNEPADSSDAASDGGALWPLAYTGFAVAGVGVVLGAITGGVSLSKAGDVKDQCTNDVCPTSTESDADTSLALGHVSTVSFVVGGAGAVLGVVALALALTGDGEEPAADDAVPSATLEPQVGLGFVGLRGTF